MNAASTMRTQQPVAIPRPSLFKLRRGAAFGIIILVALAAFEIFNYSTTDYALSDVLGGLKFAGIRWSTILAVAFCGIDFAGIARLFSPERGASEPHEAWYLFGAWLLAATMNAALTWWGVSMAVASHAMASATVIAESDLLKVVPVFVAAMVWLIRILIIGSLSYTGGRIFSTPVRTARPRPLQMARPSAAISTQAGAAPATSIARQQGGRPAPATVSMAEVRPARPEPTYHSMTMRSAATSPAARRPNDPRR